jgi:hypothetical protein
MKWERALWQLHTNRPSTLGVPGDAGEESGVPTIFFDPRLSVSRQTRQIETKPNSSLVAPQENLV